MCEPYVFVGYLRPPSTVLVIQPMHVRHSECDFNRTTGCISVKSGKKIPQYCLDGKSRKGCVSKKTGRTEIDFTLYNPDTKKVLVHRTLKDKQGEQTAALAILRKEAKRLTHFFFISHLPHHTNHSFHILGFKELPRRPGMAISYNR